MPTTLPRYTITETAPLAKCLDIAAKTWPELDGNRAALVRKLIAEGAKTIAEQNLTKTQNRQQTIMQAAGILTGVYPANAASALKEEWPK